MEKRKRIFIILSFFIFIFILLVKIFSYFTFAYKVTINNEFIGYYYNYEEYNELLKVIQEEKENNNIETYKFVSDTPIFNKIIVKNTNIKKYDKRKLIEPFITKNYNLYQINYNNNLYYFKTNEEAENFKKQLEKYDNKNQISIQAIVSDNADLITNKEKLEEILNNLDQKQKQQEKVVTSRSGNSINRYNNTSEILSTYNYISSYYRTNNRPDHTGIDFAAPSGTSVFSWKSGTVELANWNGSYGNMVIINHNNGQKTRYAHLSSICCYKGQSVNSGQLIGRVGSTGNSTGPHLHFELLINNIFVNPLNYYKN